MVAMTAQDAVNFTSILGSVTQPIAVILAINAAITTANRAANAAVSLMVLQVYGDTGMTQDAIHVVPQAVMADASFKDVTQGAAAATAVVVHLRWAAVLNLLAAAMAADAALALAERLKSDAGLRLTAASKRVVAASLVPTAKVVASSL